MRIVLSNDKFGYTLKNATLEMLSECGHDVTDLGTKSEVEALGHASAAEKVARCIQANNADLGILFCGTGMGVALAANKFKGIQAGVCESVFAAKYSKVINDCNVLCMGAYIIGPYMAMEMAKVFVNTHFAEGFEEKRAENLIRQRDLIQKFEDENFYR